MNFRPVRRRRFLEIVLDITPLVDVVFQLLLFFVLTTSFAYDSGFSVDIPEARAGQPGVAQSDLVVAIDAEGRWIFEFAVRGPAELEGLLSERAAARPDATVVIQADRGVSHGDVVRLMDVVKSAGFRRLAIATVPESR